MAKKAKAPGKRIYLLDEIRGADIILMIFFHAFYVFGWLMGWEIGKDLFKFFSPVQPLFAGIFIFICGICSRLSHNNWLRGGLLAGVAALISLVMYFLGEFMEMPSLQIWFGILHSLSVCILLFAILRPLLNKIPAWLGLLCSAVLAILCWHMPFNEGHYFGVAGVFELPLPTEWLSCTFLYPLGLGSGGVTAGSDYFPLFPWFFVFLAGTFVGKWAAAGQFPKWTRKSHIPFLSAVGQHSLIIYVVHQPVIYGVCLALVEVISWF